MKKYTAALERYKSGGLSVRAPMHARVLTGLSRALFRAGRIADCLRRAEECLYYREDEEEAVKWKCKALMKLGREEEVSDEVRRGGAKRRSRINRDKVACTY